MLEANQLENVGYRIVQAKSGPGRGFFFNIKKERRFAMAYINRKIFLEARNCMRKAWLMARDRINGVREELTEHQEFMLDSGGRINELARERFPGGVLVADTDAAAAAEKTRELMNDASVRAIFNAAFVSGAMIARPDIIARGDGCEDDGGGGAWRLIDVKSAPYYRTAAKRPRSRTGKYFTEAAFNLMVMRDCGVSVAGVSAMFVSRHYRPERGPGALFTSFDCAGEAEKLLKSFEKISGPIIGGLTADEMPAAAMTTICKNCGYYSDCPVSEVKDPVFLFNSINQKRFAQMIEDGYLSIGDIPDGYFRYPADGLYYMMRESVKTGEPFVGHGFKKALDAVRWPAHYLDFESLATVLPLYRGGQPYEHMLVQYSLHIKESPSCATENIRHFEYIAQPGRDCRRELFESLVENIGGCGSIIVYSDFEKLCIRRAAERHPHLRERLCAMQERIFDLCEFMRKNYYHPDFKGLYSIKKTLPVLVPGMNYDDLSVSNGGEAIVKHYNLAAGNLSAEEGMRARRELLEYCARDTMAMVRLHERLIEIGLGRKA